MKNKKQIFDTDFAEDNPNLTSNLHMLNMFVTNITMANWLIESSFEKIKAKEWQAMFPPNVRNYLQGIVKNHKSTFTTGADKSNLILDCKEYNSMKDAVPDLELLIEFSTNKKLEELKKILPMIEKLANLKSDKEEITKLIELSDGIDNLNLLKLKSWLMVVNPKNKKNENI